MIMEEKVALAACSGMSPNGLVARVAVHDLAIDDVEILSICMGSTSANVTGFKRMLDKFHRKEFKLLRSLMLETFWLKLNTRQMMLQDWMMKGKFAFQSLRKSLKINSMNLIWNKFN